MFECIMQCIFLCYKGPKSIKTLVLVSPVTDFLKKEWIRKHTHKIVFTEILSPLVY